MISNRCGKAFLRVTCTYACVHIKVLGLYYEKGYSGKTN